VVWISAPRERGVTVDEAGGDRERVDSLLLEEADDRLAGLVDVAGLDRLICKGRCAGDGAVEVVGVGSAEGRDGEAGLGEAGGELGVSVDDGADGWELAV